MNNFRVTASSTYDSMYQPENVLFSNYEETLNEASIWRSASECNPWLQIDMNDEQIVKVNTIRY